jgi:hypothetical protein
MLPGRSGAVNTPILGRDQHCIGFRAPATSVSAHADGGIDPVVIGTNGPPLTMGSTRGKLRPRTERSAAGEPSYVTSGA